MVGELLIALAIIGALSALLLPAFAHARANGRTAVCLGNIRTIAQAVRMYVGDNDGSLPPMERDPEVLAYFDTRPGGGGTDQWNPAKDPNCHLRATQSNPYLHWPVILDEYLLTRDVWRCPDARLEGGASFINGGEDWARPATSPWSQVDPSLFEDNIWFDTAGSTPTVQNPQNPLSQTKVDHWGQRYRVGSTVSPNGKFIQDDTFQRYRDHGRNE